MYILTHALFCYIKKGTCPDEKVKTETLKMDRYFPINIIF